MNHDTPALIRAMLQPEFYPHPVAGCELIETHISWVILAGEFAYKIKKPLDLGFLDFSTLARRKHCCEEELRLNRRLAPDIYLDLLSIGGNPESPAYGVSPALEYAVRMRRFDGAQQFDRLLARGELSAEMIDATARRAAKFHQQIAGATPPAGLGDAKQIWQPMAQNFQQIQAQKQELATRLPTLEQWSQQTYQALHPLLEQRLAQGFIRECHGDMHLGNMAWIDGQALVFDGIEFNPALRWIDIISEVAFTVMDLHQHDQPTLAWRFLNTWLEYSGDYHGLALLRFYLVYRAMVRAKIAAIRLAQLAADSEGFSPLRQEFSRYLALAEHFSHTPQARLLICHGLSGSGKSVGGMALLEQIGGVRLRSDVERKRLHGLSPEQQAGQGLYQAEVTRATYEHLAGLAEKLLAQGFSVLVDATFLDPQQREMFRRLAHTQGCPFHILHFHASEATLRQRLAERKGDASDADDSVLNKQLASYQALSAQEQDETITIDTEAAQPLQQALEVLKGAA